MNKRIYAKRMTFSVYDENHVIAYLNEEILEKYLPDNADEGDEPYTAYAYTGPEADGGTMLETNSTDRDALVNAVIRSKYTQTEEDAIKTHQLMMIQNPDCAKASGYSSEWSVFLVEREYAINLVDRWLAE